MRIKNVLTLAAMLASSVVSMAPVARAEIGTDTVRQRAEQACYDDANKLCAEAIPDEAKITACMKVNRMKLSPGCRKIFDEGVK